MTKPSKEALALRDRLDTCQTRGDQIAELDIALQQARDKALEDARRIARKYADAPIGGEAQDTQEAFDLGMVYSTGAADNAAAIEEAITALKTTASGEHE